MNLFRKKNGQIIYPLRQDTAPPSIEIVDGRVIDPVNGIDEPMTLCCRDGSIVSVSKRAPAGFSAEVTIDAQGCWVVPGLVDMHVHLREPGREDKETIVTGTQAASAGGFTAVACMPNTSPVLDDESQIKFVVERGRDCTCRVYPVGSITNGLAGNEVSSFTEMMRVGARAFSDDGRSVYRAGIMRDALRISRSLGVPILCHCEDPDLAAGGAMNEGAASARLGIPGIPSVTEDIIVARDCMLARHTGARIHICHVSTKGAIEYIRQAKSRGVKVTSETCPHYIVFTDEDVTLSDTNKKMNPPLRTAEDRDAIMKALSDGTIDCIASDHAPHCPEEKALSFEKAPFGVIGLETSLGVILTHLVHPGILSPAQLVNRMSILPCSILDLPGGSLSVGAAADITIIEPDAPWTVDSSCFYSKSRNTPFDGMELRGNAKYTIMGGRIVYERSGR